MFGRGVQSYATGINAVMLDIATRLRSWVGDCFFDKMAGVDWLNLLGFNQSAALKNSIKSVIMKTAGVIKVNNVQLVTTANRAVTVSLNVDTVYGQKVQDLEITT